MTSTQTPRHQPVLLDKCVELLLPAIGRAGAVAVDGTLGLAGHSEAFLTAADGLRLIGIDRDQEALAVATDRLSPFGSRFIPVHSSFDRLSEVLEDQGLQQVDAVFLDLGLSSLQIDETERGFSYSADSPLDMRMDEGQELTAAQVLNSYSGDELTRIFRDYGEERYAALIARRITQARQAEPFSHSAQLVDLVDQVVPRYRRPAGNPAKRVFQALRIEVNGELDKLRSVLPQVASHLKVGGRLVVESYHSLEDRITKSFFNLGTQVDLPHGLPVVPQQMEPFFKDVSHGAIKADEAEVQRNSRSGSVRLRAVELVNPLPDRAFADFRTWLQAPATKSGPAGRGGRTGPALAASGRQDHMRRAR